MPNKRKTGKLLLGGYFDESLVKDFKLRAMELNLTVRDLLEVLIRAEVKKTERNNNA